MADDSSLDARRRALTTKLHDYQQMAECLDSKGFELLSQEWAKIKTSQEQFLHNINVDDRVREHACWVIATYDTIFASPKAVAQMSQQLKMQLEELDKNPNAPIVESTMDALMNFIR